MLLNLTSIGFTKFFRCLIFELFFFTNADVVTIKDETSKKNCETDADQIKEQDVPLTEDSPQTGEPLKVLVYLTSIFDD